MEKQKRFLLLLLHTFFETREMSGNPYGNGFGRNSGQRGRIDNRNRLACQGMNPSQYVDYCKNNRKNPSLSNIRRHDEMEMDDTPKSYMNRTQIVENNRLKRKRTRFEEFDKQFIKQIEKKKIKDEAKKALRELSKRQKEMGQQNQKEEMEV